MGFYEHLDELRTRLMRCLMAFFAGFIACYFMAEPMLAVLRKPLFDALPPESRKLYFTSLFENFMTHLKIAGYASVFLLSPYFFFQIWNFIAPGLYPNVALLSNLTPDHIDRHGTLKAYAAAKARLFAMQAPGRTAIIGSAAEAEFDVLEDAEDPFIQFIEDVETGSQADWPALQGPHNLQNARAAVAACVALGLDAEQIEAGLRTYPGLPHRMERVAEKHGVLWVNDSKATNPDSTAPALAAFPNTHWIAGGRAKGADLEAVKPFLSGVRAAYLIGEAAPVFGPILAPLLPVTMSGTLEQAVADCAAAARPGDTVLLSPACASFDQFSDFEARGDAFRRAVEALS